MKRIYLILLTLSGFMASSCLKNAPAKIDLQQNPFINAARQYFTDSVLTSGSQPIDYKAKVGRTILWEKAQYLKLPTSDAILVPIQYKDPLFIKATFTGNNILHLDDLTKLLIYKHPGEPFHTEVLTAIPDTGYLRLPETSFRGYVLSEDWQGNTTSQYLYTQNGVRKYETPTTQASAIVRYCNVIYGYNYAINAPGDGYNWSQQSACYNMYLPDRQDDVHGGLGTGLGSKGGSSSGINIAFIPPDNPIANIADYIKCFTNVGGTDHVYTVTICVEQPKPGLREAYKFTPGGPIGSIQAGNIVDVGHTFLVFTEQYGGTTITRNIGFYPSRGVTPKTPSAPGKLNNDENHSYNISATFTVTSSNFFLILNYAGKGGDASFNYNLDSENCTTFSLQALAQGGISLPSTIGSWPGGMGCNPGDLGEDIRQMSTLPNMTKGTVQNFHPNVGNCI